MGKINSTDFTVISMYLLIGIFIWVSYKFSIIPQEIINLLLLALTFAGPISLFLMYYKRFRIPSVSIIWLCIGVLQWVFVSRLKDNPDFDAVVGTYANYDLNLLVIIVVLTFLRLLSLLIAKQEFMLSFWFSPKDNRKLNLYDYVFTFIGVLLLMFGAMYL